jgi:hypothetical protein
MSEYLFNQSFSAQSKNYFQLQLEISSDNSTRQTSLGERSFELFLRLAKEDQQDRF